MPAWTTAWEAADRIDSEEHVAWHAAVTQTLEYAVPLPHLAGAGAWLPANRRWELPALRPGEDHALSHLSVSTTKASA